MLWLTILLCPTYISVATCYTLPPATFYTDQLSGNPMTTPVMIFLYLGRYKLISCYQIMFLLFRCIFLIIMFAFVQIKVELIFSELRISICTLHMDTFRTWLVLHLNVVSSQPCTWFIFILHLYWHSQDQSPYYIQNTSLHLILDKNVPPINR